MKCRAGYTGTLRLAVSSYIYLQTAFGNRPAPIACRQWIESE